VPAQALRLADVVAALGMMLGAALTYQHATEDRDRAIARALGGMIEAAKRAEEGAMAAPPTLPRDGCRGIDAGSSHLSTLRRGGESPRKWAAELAIRMERATGIEPAFPAWEAITRFGGCEAATCMFPGRGPDRGPTAVTAGDHW
jgi:hypothetical protein